MKKNVNVTVRLTPDQVLRLEELKSETGLSKGEIVRQLLQRAEVDGPRFSLR